MTDKAEIQQSADPDIEGPARRFGRLLEPMDRISEVLFGVIMALTFTCTLGVVVAGDNKVKTMLIAALGCNLAWGIIDAGVFLLARLHAQGAKLRTSRAVRDAPDISAARRALAEALPPLIATTLSGEQLEFVRQELKRQPEPADEPQLTKRDGLGAMAVCLLSFLSTFPIAVPFIFIGDAHVALRVSNAVAIAMLFLLGYALGRHSGIKPWVTGIALVVLGATMVGVAIALGG